MTGSWVEALEYLACWDLETTGTDVETDRVVTASVVTTHPDGPPTTMEWLLNPGVDIPAGATEKHGITTGHAAEHGMDPAVGLAGVVAHLAEALQCGRQLVGMNICFDFTILDRDCRRHGVPTLSDVTGGRIAPVLDILVIDRLMDRYRKGGQTLADLCATYGVTIEGAHTSTGDTMATLEVLRVMAERSQGGDAEILDAYRGRGLRYPGEMVRAWRWLGHLTVDQLHTELVVAARRQDQSFATFQRGRVQELRAQAAREPDDERRAKLLAEADQRAGWADAATGEWPIKPRRRTP